MLAWLFFRKNSSTSATNSVKMHPKKSPQRSKNHHSEKSPDQPPFFGEEQNQSKQDAHSFSPKSQVVHSKIVNHDSSPSATRSHIRKWVDLQTESSMHLLLQREVQIVVHSVVLQIVMHMIWNRPTGRAVSTRINTYRSVLQGHIWMHHQFAQQLHETHSLPLPVHDRHGHVPLPDRRTY